MSRRRRREKARALAPVSLLPLIHDSRQRRRLKKHPEWTNAERYYAAAWKRLMREHPDWLHRILAPDGREFGVVSPRDAEVAATIVQWLGTNVGGGFVRGVEKTIHNERARGWERRHEAWLIEMRDRAVSANARDVTRMIDVS